MQGQRGTYECQHRWTAWLGGAGADGWGWADENGAGSFIQFCCAVGERPIFGPFFEGATDRGRTKTTGNGPIFISPGWGFPLDGGDRAGSVLGITEDFAGGVDAEGEGLCVASREGSAEIDVGFGVAAPEEGVFLAVGCRAVTFANLLGAVASAGDGIDEAGGIEIDGRCCSAVPEERFVLMVGANAVAHLLRAGDSQCEGTADARDLCGIEIDGGDCLVAPEEGVLVTAGASGRNLRRPGICRWCRWRLNR